MARDLGWWGLNWLTGVWRLGFVARMGEKVTVLQFLADGAGNGFVDRRSGGV